MTKEEARLRCDELAREHPDRATHRFVPRQGEDGGWEVARINLPPADSREVTAETAAEEKPAAPDDPRSAIARNLPGTSHF